MSIRQSIRRFCFASSVAVVALTPAASVHASSGWSYKEIADALHAIMESDRTVYTLSLIHI